MTQPPIRILLADDHPVVRDGLAAMLATQPDFQVVAQAASGAEALGEAERTRPDVVLLDLEMPGMDGLEALRRLQQARPELPAHLTPFTVLELLTRVRSGRNLSDSQRAELDRAIGEIERHFFAAETNGHTPDLRRIAERWLSALPAQKLGAAAS